MELEKRALDRYLAGLPLDQIADLLEQQLLHPDPVETDVLRRDHNVPRAAQAIEIVLRRIARRRKTLKRLRGANSRQARHLQRLEHIAGSERRALLRRLTDMQSSPERAQPTARSRASRRLEALHPQEYVQLVREEQASIEWQRKASRRRVREEIEQTYQQSDDPTCLPGECSPNWP